MKELTLVVMAAGLGSRFGGMKQVEPLGPNGEILIDYSVYDAAKAGFNKVVFIIKEEMRGFFEEAVAKRAQKLMKVGYVYQGQKSYLPEWFEYPESRAAKPWGTAHAIYCCKDELKGAFAVINADDFYGRESFGLIADYLTHTQDKSTDDKAHFCMAGYVIKNTLSENGLVTRGICTETEDGYLKNINERTNVGRYGDRVMYENEQILYEVNENSIVSLNMWGFTPKIFDIIGDLRDEFFKGLVNKDKEEFLLPVTVDKAIKSGKADVKVLKTNSKWYGVTYREDKGKIMSVLKELYESGQYPKLTE